MLKPPEGITALLLDLGGVITQTAKLHAAAWKEMFDDFLRERAEQTGEPFEEFTPSKDALGRRRGGPRRRIRPGGGCRPDEQRDALAQRGADIVVDDLSELIEL